MSNLDGGFYAIAATGAAGSQSNYWGEVVSVTKSGSSYLTGKYWPASDPGLTSFYASNVSPTFAASGPTVTLADCNTDVVCAHAASPTYGVNCPLTFNHVLARVGTITLNTKSGYELSGVTATLKNGVTGGTYNLRTGAWSSLGAGSDKSTGAFSGNTSAQTSNNDIWLIPGTYTISLSYTLTKGDYVYNAVNKTGSVTILAGNTNNITTTAVGVDATEIVFNVSLTAWSPYDVALDMSYGGAINLHPFTLDGHRVYFTTSNLTSYWGSSSSYKLHDNPWDYTAGNRVQEKTDHMGWATTGYGMYAGESALHIMPPSSTSSAATDYGPAIASGEWESEKWDWGVYHNPSVSDPPIKSAGGLSIGHLGLRTPTKAEMLDLTKTTRSVSSGTKYAYCQAMVSGVRGMIAFSDDYVHPAGVPAISNLNKSSIDYAANTITSEQFGLMAANGAIFLPSAGTVQTSSSNDVSTDSSGSGNYCLGYYWTSTAYSEREAYAFMNSGSPVVGPTYRSVGCCVRLILPE